MAETPKNGLSPHWFFHLPSESKEQGVGGVPGFCELSLSSQGLGSMARHQFAQEMS
jgi:hypothetical protein